MVTHRLTLRFLVAALVLGLAVLTVHSAVRAQARPPVTFNHDVAAIIYANCVGCHRPEASAPFSLLTYEDVRQRSRTIAEVTSAHVMPPWQPESPEGLFSDERRLEAAEIETLRQWVADGALEGNADERPAVPVFTASWQLGTPDVVVTMPQPFDVPADGPDVFRNFVLPVPLAERRYVRALEFRPGNARVLHHARLLLDDTGDVRRVDAQDVAPGFGGMDVPGARFPDGHFLGWAPGKRAAREAFPWPIEPGTDIVVQMHLKPSGRAERVQASIGLYLTDRPPAQTPLMLRLGSKTIDIPADESAYEVRDTFELPADVTVLSIYPHAHYLAKEMQITARAPNGDTETLLHIPNWNFNWQDEYEYSEPVALPRGTTIEMRYRYDNSAENPHNPSAPPRRVVFGSETTDEMGELLVQVLTKTPDDGARLRAQVARKNLLTDVAGEEKRVSDVPADYETRNALAVAYLQVGRKADALRQFQAVLGVAPDYPLTHYNLAVIALAEQRMSDAIAELEHALKARPDYAEAHNNLGVVLERTGRAKDAEQQYREALVARPSHAAAHNNLGRALLARGETAEALAHFRAALRSQPDHPDALYGLGRALLAQGHAREAEQTWRRALVERPDGVVVMIDLAWLLATQAAVRDPHNAVKMAERANQLSGRDNPLALDVLAAAYAAEGRVDLAVRTARHAFERAMALKNDDLAAAIRRRLESYQSTTGDRDGPRIP